MSAPVPPPPAALPPPGGRRVRRLTRWPVVIGSLAVVLPFAVGGYALTHRGTGISGVPADDDVAASTRGANAGAALAHAGDGEIQRAALVKPLTPAAATPALDRPAAPAAVAPPGETDIERKMRAKAWDAYYGAVAAEKDRRMAATLAALTADTLPSNSAAGGASGSPGEAAGGPGGAIGIGGGPGVAGGQAAGLGGGKGAPGYFGAHGASDPSSDYSPYSLTEPLSPYELKAGDVITGTLATEINSDSPGAIVGYVGRPVLDYATHSRILIPQGTRIVGSYNSQVAYGQSRLEVGLERLIYPAPCAQSLDLGRMAGSDVSGRAGFEDQTNNHYGKMFIQAILLAGVSAGVQLSQPQQNAFGYPTPGQIAAGALGQQLGQIGLENAQRGMNIPPTQEIRNGYAFTLILQHDIAFTEPYSCPEAGIVDGVPWGSLPAASGLPISLAPDGR